MNWYCIHTRPQREQFVAEQLSTFLGLEVYFPTIRLHKTIRRVRREVVEPLFPRYLFCRCDLTTDYRAVRYARDVIDLVSFGAQPARVDEQLIAQIKAWAESNALPSPASAFSAGEQVEITFGPMQGLHAVILDAHNDRERVAVLLSILGCDARLTIDRSLLAKAI
ncbi:MAG: transcription termination/antitermination NusG family protein [Nibricoccus sp.]